MKTINFCLRTPWDIVKIYLMIIIRLSKFETSWKLAKKGDFGFFLDPFWGFILKTVLGIHDPGISW